MKIIWPFVLRSRHNKIVDGLDHDVTEARRVLCDNNVVFHVGDRPEIRIMEVQNSRIDFIDFTEPRGSSYSVPCPSKTYKANMIGYCMEVKHGKRMPFSEANQIAKALVQELTRQFMIQRG